MTDYLWNGPETTVAAAIYQADGKTLKDGYAVIGPRTLDGISYINLRTDAVLTPPVGISETGEQLSAALIGTWAPATAEAAAANAAANTETSITSANASAPTSTSDAATTTVTTPASAATATSADS